MGHCVQLIVGRPETLVEVVGLSLDTPIVELDDGWAAAPLGEGLSDAIAGRFAGDPIPAGFDLAPAGLDACLRTASAKAGPLAYVETDYFGGIGHQNAGAWVGGQCAFAQAGGSAINAALEAIGVAPADEADAFDTIGLGSRRTTADYFEDAA